VNYRLTRKGIDLAPLLLEMLIWGGKHEKNGLPAALIAKMEHSREEVLAEVRRRWREGDSTPLFPSQLEKPVSSKKEKKAPAT
jgi:hypothetical protein